MDKLKRTVLWMGLVLILLLIFLSIYGAFLGAQRAQAFFNSLPLAIYWLVFILLLIAGIVLFRRLIYVPALLLIHTGCILVIAGSIWASQAGHEMQKKLFGIDKIPAGRMAIFKGESENKVLLENTPDSVGSQIQKLPFLVKLKDFRIEYYEPAYLQIFAQQGKNWKIPVEIGKEFLLGPEFGTVTIVRTFENFKITIDGQNKTAIDAPQPGYNPALEVQLKYPEGNSITQYVFERFPGQIRPEDKFILRYRRDIRDYISELEIIKDGKTAAEKNIEVNRPLHFGGYHFYQTDYDKKAGQYTILKVVSDTGLNAVYAGYTMLCVGILWHFWLKKNFAAIKRKND